MPRLSVRNHSLLQAGLGHLVKSITAAKYILTTLTVLSITWTPWLLTLSYGIIINKNSHHNASLNYKVNMIRKFSIGVSSFFMFNSLSKYVVLSICFRCRNACTKHFKKMMRIVPYMKIQDVLMNMHSTL